ncbi:putative rsc complex subunit rsc9 [Diplodia seriata]|uniref:Putative rsc complex subunit rsc9 n=1 Tax=Diplodia seriata TaxID=420778 RepID=A0A0G2GBI0_9PEZI|nr:putative rsc complex subunit rsc9 [Diplodia seriata]
MAPERPRESSIERTSEYDDFMNKLEDYHAKRGTTLDREPKVGQRHLNLFQLYQRVCEEGGYDKVSDTKNNKLAWRRIAADFIPPDQNPTTQAFIVKKAYYKNLAAYEIKHFHGKEPPPKEILEHVSAKGGDLLRRTRENFSASNNRELESLTNGQDKDSDESEDEPQKTPKEDKMDLDGPPGSTGRVTRGSYPQPNGSFSGGGNSMSIIANYEPKPVVPSNVKPVMTPSNNPEHFRSLRSRMTSSTLFYGFHWEICYTEDESLERNDTLNAISGTAKLLQKIRSHPLLDFTDDVQTREFSESLGRVNEAGLVIRNLVMLEANAHYVAQLPLIQDFITIALNLPLRSSVIELKHYALEIAEQLSRYWILNSEHHLYQTLLAQLDSSDRGTIITALRALSRIAMNANPRYELINVPPQVIQHVCEWLLVEDEQLREACLDFLYLYTATTENVETLTQHTDVEGLVKQLVRLLLYNAQTIRLPASTKAPGKPTNTAAETAPKLATSIIDQLLSLDEPDLLVIAFDTWKHGTTCDSGKGAEAHDGR